MNFTYTFMVFWMVLLLIARKCSLPCAVYAAYSLLVKNVN